MFMHLFPQVVVHFPVPSLSMLLMTSVSFEMACVQSHFLYLFHCYLMRIPRYKQASQVLPQTGRNNYQNKPCAKEAIVEWEYGATFLDRNLHTLVDNNGAFFSMNHYESLTLLFNIVRLSVYNNYCQFHCITPICAPARQASLWESCTFSAHLTVIWPRQVKTWRTREVTRGLRKTMRPPRPVTRSHRSPRDCYLTAPRLHGTGPTTNYCSSSSIKEAWKGTCGSES